MLLPPTDDCVDATSRGRLYRRRRHPLFFVDDNLLRKAQVAQDLDTHLRKALDHLRVGRNAEVDRYLEGPIPT